MTQEIKSIQDELCLPVMEWVSNDFVLNEVAETDKEGRLAVRADIEEFQAIFEHSCQEVHGTEAGEMEAINSSGLTEYFVGGAYTRGLLIPKGNVIVSHIWKKPRMWIISSGDVTIKSELGIRRVKAPCVCEAPYGSKIVLYAHEDTQWFAITGLELEGEFDIKKDIIAEDYSSCVYPWDDLKEGAL